MFRLVIFFVMSVFFVSLGFAKTDNYDLHADKKESNKIIGYMPGWVDSKVLPEAKALHEAGYTHIMVAFGLFSTKEPGQIVSDFPSITPGYIDSLHQEGIKVLLSLGGASSGIPDTSVNFHDVLKRAETPDIFQAKFVSSLKQLIAENHFDGFDIDIEHGLAPGAGGTYSDPKGDIAVLAKIINQMHADNPNLLITMAPESPNIGATNTLDGTWGNYAALIMQTHDALSWVGIQLYNTGCVYGLDGICYSDVPNSPNFSVAMAADLLENWPEKDKEGRPQFAPYISYLRPDQIVLGYPAPNKDGVSDGQPAKPTYIIKRAIQCLRTNNEGCDSYKAPRAYPGISGVFEWEITYDQSNGFKFAKELKSCVMDGNCN